MDKAYLDSHPSYVLGMVYCALTLKEVRQVIRGSASVSWVSQRLGYPPNSGIQH